MMDLKTKNDGDNDDAGINWIKYPGKGENVRAF